MQRLRFFTAQNRLQRTPSDQFGHSMACRVCHHLFERYRHMDTHQRSTIIKIRRTADNRHFNLTSRFQHLPPIHYHQNCPGHRITAGEHDFLALIVVLVPITLQQGNRIPLRICDSVTLGQQSWHFLSDSIRRWGIHDTDSFSFTGVAVV